MQVVQQLAKQSAVKIVRLDGTVAHMRDSGAAIRLYMQRDHRDIWRRGEVAKLIELPEPGKPQWSPGYRQTGAALPQFQGNEVLSSLGK